jgi:phage terminase large subunit GpA-like protein
LKRKKPLDEDDELPFGWAHFPEWPEEYFKQLCAEQLVTRVVRGYQKFQWEKIRDRNEILDLRVYARSCVTALGCDRWDEKRWLKESSKVNPITEKKAPSSEKGLKRRRGSFLKR